MKTKSLIFLALLTIFLLILLALSWKSSWTKPNGRKRCLIQIAVCGSAAYSFREGHGRRIEEMPETKKHCFCPITKEPYHFIAMSNGFVIVEDKAHNGGRSWVDQDLKATTI